MKTFISKSDILNRLKSLFNVSKDSELSEILGISKSTLSNWIKRDSIDYDLVFSKCEHANLDWLLTGQGEMLKQQNCAPNEGENNHQKVIPIKDNLKTADGIPLIPIDAMAGALSNDFTVFEYECERYVVPAFKGADFLIPVKGFSMFPNFNSGDIVACKRVPMSDLFFQWNKVYVIDTNQGALIKRIKPGSNPDHVLIVSDNDKFDPFELPYSAIYTVALVIGVIRLE